MTTAELFEAFGGRERIMAITGQSRNAINHWLLDGVPFRHFSALRKAARKAGIPGITDEALAGTRPAQPRRRKAA